MGQVKCRPTTSNHVPPSWPRIDTRGVRYLSRLPERSRPFPRLGSDGTPAPTEPPTPHMPAAGARRCANASVAPKVSSDRVTINRRLARILSISFLSDVLRVVLISGELSS